MAKQNTKVAVVDTKTSEMKINIEDGKTNVDYRVGKLPDLPPELIPGRVDLKGTISAPSEFVSKRNTEFGDKITHVLYSYTDKKIQLLVNEQHLSQSHQITGSLIDSDELGQLPIFKGIGSPVLKQAKDLIQLLRFNKGLFFDASEFDAVMKGVGNLKAKVSREIESITNNAHKGERRTLDDIKIEGNFDLNFRLNIPLFKGHGKVVFAVDVCYEVKDNGIFFWLESTELTATIQEQTKTIIDKELTQLSKYVCIQY